MVFGIFYHFTYTNAFLAPGLSSASTAGIVIAIIVIAIVVAVLVLIRRRQNQGKVRPPLHHVSGIILVL